VEALHLGEDGANHSVAMRPSSSTCSGRPSNVLTLACMALCVLLPDSLVRLRVLALGYTSMMPSPQVQRIAR
jgi:hypothetical protein